MKVFHKSGLILDHLSAAGIASGVSVLFGKLVCLAQNIIAAGATGPVLSAGIVKVTKLVTAADVFAEGDPVYRTSGADTFQRTRTDDYAGIAHKAAIQAATTLELLMNVGRELGIENDIADPGDGVAIPVIDSGNIQIVTAAAETNTLAAPSAEGQELLLVCKTHAVGDRVVTVATLVNQTGNNTLTFGAAGDTILLKAMNIGDVVLWRVAYNDGVALSTV